MTRRALKLAVGLRSTTQSISLLGIETGQFASAGLDVSLAGMEVAGPRAAAGLRNGEWHIAEVGSIPVVQAIAAGEPLVIIGAVEPHSALFIVGRAGLTNPAALRGGRIGVLTRDGQTGFLACAMLARWGLADDVAVIEAKTYPKIFHALCDGTIDAGVLSVDYFFAGERDAGLNALVDLSKFFAIHGPCLVATSETLRDRSADIAAFAEGYVRAIHFYKTRPAQTVAFLVRHLGFEAAIVEKIHRFYFTRFQSCPLPSREALTNAIAHVHAALPEDRRPRPADLCDTTAIEALRDSGFIASLSQTS